MELRNLITFIYVAELGSFSKAAKQLQSCYNLSYEPCKASRLPSKIPKFYRNSQHTNPF